LGTGSSTEQWSGEAGHGQKGMPFIIVFRMLKDVAMLITPDLIYIKTTFFPRFNYHC